MKRKAILLCLCLGLVQATNPQSLMGEELLIEHPTIKALLKKVNAARARNGRKPLIADDKLAWNAQRWANYQDWSKDWSHNSNRAGAEVIGRGYSSPRSVIQGWMNSPGHRNILLGDYTHVGFGMQSKRSGTNYWVGVFVSKWKRAARRRRPSYSNNGRRC